MVVVLFLQAAIVLIYLCIVFIDMANKLSLSLLSEIYFTNCSTNGASSRYE